MKASTNTRRSPDAVAPVHFGTAGVIYLSDSRDTAADQAWLAAGFRMTPNTARIEWRGDNILAVSYQHAAEAGIREGSYRCAVPSRDDWQGIGVGSFFGRRDVNAAPDATSAAIVDAFSRTGPASFKTLNGAWVSLVWNSRTREAHFSRDRLGLHTLYATRVGERIVFSTDLRVLQIGELLGEQDDQAVAEFLHYLYVPAPRTLARGCTAVLPGHVLTLGMSSSQEKYADPTFVAGRALNDDRQVDAALDEALPIFEQKLLEAVADCIPPQGSVAVTLSGGKDSSTLAVALSKICPERVIALTIGEKDARISEANDAALVCRALGLRHQTYVPDDAALAAGIYEFARAQDQPTGDPAALPYFLGVRELPSDCAVVIDGSGNDNYFGIPSQSKGRPFERRRNAQRRVPAALWSMLVTALGAGPGKLRRLGAQWRQPIEEMFVPWNGWSGEELAALFGREVSFDDTYLWKIMRERASAPWMDVLTEAICGVWEPHAALRKAVQAANGAGKGIRFPFTDLRLARFINELPSELKFKNGVNKQILRAYMARNLPRVVVEKPKSGFIFDLNRLFANPTHRWSEELDRRRQLRVIPTWSDAPIRSLLTAYARAPHDERWQQRLFALCLLATVMGSSDNTDVSDSQYRQTVRTIH